MKRKAPKRNKSFQLTSRKVATRNPKYGRGKNAPCLMFLSHNCNVHDA